MHPDGPKKDLMDMKVTELKDELELRGESKSGNKPWLRRRLYAAIVREYLADDQIWFLALTHCESI